MTPPFSYPLLLADIGGTNTRVGLVAAAGASPALVGRVRTQDHAAIDQAIAGLVRDSGLAPRSAFLAAAGPVTGTRMEITNAAQTLDAGALGAALALDMVGVVNDFVAQAAATRRLAPSDLHVLQSGAAHPRGTTLAIGPGTGFGVGFILDAGDGFAIASSEGGHAGLGPETESEALIWPHLERVAGRITIESVVSGEGLSRIDRALAAAGGGTALRRDPAAVVDRALDGDARARRAAEIFLDLLARVAGDLTLIAKATGGAFICGGVAPRLLPLIDEARFRAAFAGRAPMGAMLAAAPLALVTAAEPAFLGLAAIADPAARLAAPDRALWMR